MKKLIKSIINFSFETKHKSTQRIEYPYHFLSEFKCDQ